MPPLVSVIITTKNESVNIGNCLSSIKNQTYNPEAIEIIVVDNNSTDKTQDIAGQYTDKVYNCGPERSSQRNFGIRQASGKYILYLDADMVLSQNVINECVKMCEEKSAIALYIPERIIGKGFWIKVRDFERSFYNGTCIGAVRFVRRDKFLEIGGFDESLTGPEDWDFDRRVKILGITGIIDYPIYHNEGNFSLGEYIKGKLYYARSFDGYINKWGKNDFYVRKQLGFGYRYFGVFFEKGKICRLVSHPVLTIEMYFLRLLIGLMYIVFKRLGH